MNCKYTLITVISTLLGLIMGTIHHLALVEEGASLGHNVTIGPFTTIGANVVIEDNVVIHEHVVIRGATFIGEGTEIYPYTTIGLPPQDLSFNGEPSQVIVGKNCKIRESVTIHSGTAKGISLTRVGDNCLLMVGAHVAHDCIIGNNVIMANYTSLAGHVDVGDYCIIGGHSAVLQFVRLGKHAMIGGMTGVTNDVTPYGMVFGNRAMLCGLNVVGLKRRGFSKDEIKEIRRLYQFIFYSNEANFEQRLNAAQEQVRSPAGAELINFLKSDSKKSFCKPEGEYV